MWWRNTRRKSTRFFNSISEQQQAFAEEQRYQAELQIQAVEKIYTGYNRFLDENDEVADSIAGVKLRLGFNNIRKTGIIFAAPVPNTVKGVALAMWGIFSIYKAVKEISD